MGSLPEDGTSTLCVLLPAVSGARVLSQSVLAGCRCRLVGRLVGTYGSTGWLAGWLVGWLVVMAQALLAFTYML